MTFSFTESKSYLYTSESVTEGHPDKLCDQISDAILDALSDNGVSAMIGADILSGANSKYSSSLIILPQKYYHHPHCLKFLKYMVF